MHSNFLSDSEQALELQVYLAREFYPILREQTGLNFRPIVSKYLQQQGIDCILYNDKVSYNIDEKAQLNKYLGNPVPTFTVELGCPHKDGSFKIGWFLNEELKTDYYLFMWILNSTSDNKFQCIRMSMVAKQVLLDNCVPDRAELWNKVLHMTTRKLSDEERDKNQKRDDYYGRPIIQSMSYAECPINLQLTFNEIKEFSKQGGFTVDFYNGKVQEVSGSWGK